MSRQITVYRTNTMQEMMQKVGQMADYAENLDGLSKTFDSPDPINGLTHDGSFVEAINYAGVAGDNILEVLFQDTPPATIITANIQSDSGKLDKLVTNTLYAADEFMGGPRIGVNPPDPDGDSAYLWHGDSQGTAGFDFDCDSANIKRLKVDHFLNVGDSAQIYEKVTVGSLMSDSGDDLGVVIDSATVTHAFINTLHMDGRSVSKVRPFFITDSAGMSGQIFFAAYQLDSAEWTT